jgi:hypothetical protein
MTLHQPRHHRHAASLDNLGAHRRQTDLTKLVEKLDISEDPDWNMDEGVPQKEKEP